MTKKIFIFSTAYLPLIGGAEIAIKEITDRIDGDFQFEMITAKLKKGLPDFEGIGNINVRRVGFGCFLDKYLLPVLGYRKAQQLLIADKTSISTNNISENQRLLQSAKISAFSNQRKSASEIIWSVMASYGGLAALFFKLKNPKIPFLLTLQEGDSKSRIFWRSLPIYPFFKMIFKKADYVQAISGYLADFAKKQGYKGEIDIVPNGIDKDMFNVFGLATDAAKLKKALNIKENEKVIVTVSRLVKKNGIKYLIESARYLKFPFKILIIGTGKLKKNLARKAEKFKDSIIFLGGIDYANLPKYYFLADVFVRPSLSEGLGNVFLEAMACGVPVAGTPVGGIPDFLKDGGTGVFCEVKNPKSIAEKISLLVEDGGLTDKLKKNGRKLVVERYNWDLIASEMRNIFDKLTFSGGKGFKLTV